MAQVVLLSLVTASVAFTLCEAALFAGLREWAKARSAWLGKLACCGYCLGRRIAFGLVAIYRSRLLEAWWLLDYVLTALVNAWPWAAGGAIVGSSGKELAGVRRPLDFPRFHRCRIDHGRMLAQRRN